MGQNCGAGSRLLLERSIQKPFLAKLKERVKEVKIGNAIDQRYNFGPIGLLNLFSKRQHLTW